MLMQTAAALVLKMRSEALPRHLQSALWLYVVQIFTLMVDLANYCLNVAWGTYRSGDRHADCSQESRRDEAGRSGMIRDDPAAWRSATHEARAYHRLQLLE